MCGLVGMAGNLNYNTDKMFRDMLIFSQLRGIDSTGVVTVPISSNVEPTLVKEVGVPTELFRLNPSVFDAKGILKGATPKVIIGHTRHATIGDTNKENAHPFKHGHIYGAHNGSLRSYKDLLGFDEHEVDSKAIFHTIAEKSIEDCWKGFFGAACLTYWDGEKKQLNIIRNDERPLVLMQSKNKDAMFWASEPWMIMAAAMKEQIALDTTADGKPLMVVPEPDKLYVYEVTGTSFKLVEGRKLEKKSYPQTTTTTGTTTHGFSGQNSGHFKRYEPSSQSNFAPLSKPISIRTDWAYNLPPAPKEIRGMRFKFITLIDSIKGAERQFYMVGETLSKERIEIYPTQAKEYYQWLRYNEQKRVADLWFEIEKRPRMKRIGNIDTYRISTQHVKLMESVVLRKDEDKPRPMQSLLLFNANGKKVSEAKWRELVYTSSIRGGCTCCGNPLAIEDHQKHKWYGDSCVLCETCGDDPTVIDYVQHYNAS